MTKIPVGPERSKFLLLLGCALSLILVAVHAYVVAQGDEYAGPLLILDHLFSVALTVGLLAVCAAVGLYLLALFRFKFDEPLEALLFSVAIGCGAMAVSILGLGFFSALQGITMAGLAVLWMLIARKQFIQLIDSVLRTAVDFKAQCSRSGLVVLTVAAVFLVSQALLPPRDWDTLMYHLRVPAQFLQQGRFFVPEDNFHVAYVQLIHMLFLPLLSAGSLAGPAVLNASLALLLGLTVFALARRFFGEATASLSLTMLWASTILLLVAITPRVDVSLAYCLLLAHFALFIAWKDWRFYYLAAALLGVAFGIKYNALLYLVVLSPLIAYVAYCRASNIGATIRHLVFFGLIFSGIALPWVLKNWLLLEAPLYPFFTQIKINSWLGFAYPDLAISGSVDPRILTMLGEVRSSLNLLDLFFNPSALTPETEANRYYFNPLFLFLPLWLIALPKERTINWLLVPPVAYFAVILLLFPKTNLRYLIPTIAPLTIGAVYLVVSRLTIITGEKKTRVAMSILAFVVLWPTLHTIILWTVHRQPLAYLAGSMSRDDYLKNDVFPPDYYFLAQAVAYANRNFTQDHRILMLFEARGFYFKIPVIQDNILVNWPLLAHKLPAIGCLEPSGISHALINTGSLSFYLKRGLDPNVAQSKTFDEFAERCLSLVYEYGSHKIYAVKKPDREKTSTIAH